MTDLGEDLIKSMKQALSHAEATQRIKELEATFRHYHKSNGKNDACAECGLDLRDSVHIRWAKDGSRK